MRNLSAAWIAAIGAVCFAAAFAAVYYIASSSAPNAGSPTPLTPQSAALHFANKSCAELAGDPVEVIDGKRGVRLDRIEAPPAVRACERAVAQRPQDAAAWRHLARSYLAGIRYWGLNESRYAGRFTQALERAASLGDPLAQLELAASTYGGETRYAGAPAMELQRLTSSLPPGAPNSIQSLARLKLEYLIHASEVSRITAIEPFSRMNATWDQYFQKGPDSLNIEDRLDRRLDAIGPVVGWRAINDHIWEMRDRDQCGGAYSRMCQGFDNGVLRADDAPTFLAISVDKLASAYRNAELAFDRVRAGTMERETALNVGHGWATSARDFANRAFNGGTPEQKRAAQDLLKAVDEFFAYNNALSRTARAEAAAASARAWRALAVLVIAALAQSGGGASSSGGGSDPQAWMDEQQRRACDDYAMAGGVEWDAARTVGGCY